MFGHRVSQWRETVAPFAPVALPLLVGAACTNAHAGFGAYLPGLGARSNGAGGIVYSLVQDTTPLSSNPALARVMGTRVDGTLAWFQSRASLAIHDNLRGRDQDVDVVDNNYFFPYAGFTVQLSDTLSFGMTGFLAGMGAVYEDSPYARFTGDDKTSLVAFQTGVSSILAYEIAPMQNVGISFNLGYDGLDLKGLGGALSYGSETPRHFTDQGLDGAFGLGFSIGWYGEITPWLAAGAAYRSKTFPLSKIDEYEGLLPDQGTLQFPAFFGGGFSLMPLPGWTFAVELQRVLYDDVLTFSNGIEQFPQDRFGADDGPGFGWRSQNVFRTAVVYEARPSLTLRAGYAHGSAQIRPANTLLAGLTPSTPRTFYSLGTTWIRDSGWEWTAALGYEPKTRLRGKDSIPAIAGGGEADVANSFFSVTLSVSRQFDFQWLEAD